MWNRKNDLTLKVLMQSTFSHFRNKYEDIWAVASVYTSNSIFTKIFSLNNVNNHSKYLVTRLCNCIDCWKAIWKNILTPANKKVETRSWTESSNDPRTLRFRTNIPNWMFIKNIQMDWWTSCLGLLNF